MCNLLDDTLYRYKVQITMIRSFRNKALKELFRDAQSPKVAVALQGRILQIPEHIPTRAA